MRFLTPRIHGILDYVAAIVLIVAPFLLGFFNTNLLALCVSLVLGLGLLGHSLVTDYAYLFHRYGVGRIAGGGVCRSESGQRGTVGRCLENAGF